MSNVIGIDCGMRKLHCVILDSNSEWIKGHEFISEEKDGVKASYEIVNSFSKIFSVPDKQYWSIEAAFIEAPIYLQNAYTSFGIAAVAFKTEYVLQNLCIPVYRVDNKHWKKLVLNKGNASKKEIMDFAKDKWGGVAQNQDMCDAAAIALFGVQLFQKER